MQLFVYGTLRRGASNHRELAGARWVGAAVTSPMYELVDMGGYPALLEGGTTAVHGEIYEVDESRMVVLDEFEEVPMLYERKPVVVQGAPVISYVMQRERAGNARRIDSGDWLARD